MNIFSHISFTEVIACFFGIVTFWVLMFSSDKDEYDDKDQKFSVKGWFNTWFTKKYDNIIAHVVVSLFGLYVGIENVEAWMGDNLHIPQSGNEIGAAGFIGLTGSYIAAILKKGVSFLKK